MVGPLVIETLAVADCAEFATLVATTTIELGDGATLGAV